MANTATACAHCNLAKGFHREDSFVEICRHIATHAGSLPAMARAHGKTSGVCDDPVHEVLGDAVLALVGGDGVERG